MARPFEPATVSANHLITGHVIYLTADGNWTPILAQAELITDPDHAAARLALAGAEPATAVGAHLAPVRPGQDNRPTPAHLREAFRAAQAASHVAENPAHA